MSAKPTYALLIYRTGPGETAQARSAHVLESHRELQREAGARGELLAAARLDAASKAKTVRINGMHDVTEGPFVESREWLVGFYLVECWSEAEAVARARGICPVGDHAIEVRPVTWQRVP